MKLKGHVFLNLIPGKGGGREVSSGEESLYFPHEGGHILWALGQALHVEGKEALPQMGSGRYGPGRGRRALTQEVEVLGNLPPSPQMAQVELPQHHEIFQERGNSLGLGRDKELLVSENQQYPPSI